MNKLTKKTKLKNLCKKCEFYDKKKDYCEARDIDNCSKQSISNCKDYLIKENLIFF